MQDNVDIKLQTTTYNTENLDTKYVVIVVEPPISSKDDIDYVCKEIDNIQSINSHFDGAPTLLNQTLDAIKNNEYRTTVYSCTKCFKIFSEKVLLEKHEETCQRTQTKSLKYRKKSTNTSSLYSTRKSSTRFGRKDREEKVNKNPSNQILENSLAIIMPRSYLCKRCFSTWESVFELHWHSVEKHNYSTPSRVNTTDSQMNCKSEEGDLIHICQRCLKCFWTASDLNKHMNDHRTEAPFVCKLCEEELNMNCFRSRQYRKSYGKLTPFRFICCFCQATFLTKRCLIEHLQIHTRDKITVICGYCEQSFRQRSNARKHIQQLHQPSTECAYCSELFYTTSKLEEHIKLVHDVRSENQLIKQSCDYSVENKFKDILLILLNSDFTKMGLSQRCPADIVSEMASLITDSSHFVTNDADPMNENGTLPNFSTHLRVLIKHLVSNEILEDINFEQCSISELINNMYKIMYCHK